MSGFEKSGIMKRSPRDFMALSLPEYENNYSNTDPSPLAQATANLKR
jgi:hypothetical protein